MTIENAQRLIQKFGALRVYLHELSPDSPVGLYSEDLLPASKKQIEEAAILCSVTSTDEEDKELLNQIKPLLDLFIPHEDALKLAQSWSGLKPKFEGKDYDKEAEKVFIEISGRYLSKV